MNFLAIDRGIFMGAITFSLLWKLFPYKDSVMVSDKLLWETACMFGDLQAGILLCDCTS